MKCKYETTKVFEGWWGCDMEEPYCTKNCQRLAGTTCENCPDFIKEEKDETKS